MKSVFMITISCFLLFKENIKEKKRSGGRTQEIQKVKRRYLYAQPCV